MTHNLLLDIETVAIDNVGAFLDAPEPPSNYKDPEKIEAWVTAAFQKMKERASLKPDLGRIVCLGWMQDDRDTEPRQFICRDEREEAKALEVFWDDLTDGDHFKRILTFNGHRFDLPFVQRRSLALRVEYPPLRVDRHSPHLDLYRLLSMDDVIDGYKQEFYLKRYGLEIDECDLHTGADVAALVAAGDWDAVKHHNRCDLFKLHALASWIPGLIDQPVEQEQPF